MELEFIEIVNEHYGLSKLPKNPVEAMAYIPYQMDNSDTFTPVQGFACGTMFPVLNKPFYGNKCGAHND